MKLHVKNVTPLMRNL